MRAARSAAATEFTQGERHPRRLVRFRLEPPRRAHRQRTTCPGPPTSTSKAATSIAAGSTARCWSASGCKGSAPYRACATNGWALDGEGRAMSQVARQRRSSPRRSSSNHGADVLRLWAASVDFNEDVRISETILDAPHRGLPQAAQHLPLRARQPRRFRSRDRRRARRRACSRSTSGSCSRAEDLVARCRAWYDEFAFHKVYRARLRFRHRRPQLRLLRRAEGPPLHRGHQIARAPQRPDRALPPRTTRWCACSRRSSPSPPKKSGPTWASPAASTCALPRSLPN